MVLEGAEEEEEEEEGMEDVGEDGDVTYQLAEDGEGDGVEGGDEMEEEEEDEEEEDEDEEEEEEELDLQYADDEDEFDETDYLNIPDTSWRLSKP